MNQNPLKQYFRRPSIHVTIPTGGKHYSAQVLEVTETGQLPIYPMTANDEIISRTPDALFNGSAVASVIQSCVPAVKNAWALDAADVEALMIAIRIATNGEEMDIETTCPECREESAYGVNLSGVLTQVRNPDFNIIMELGDLQIKFRSLTFKEMNSNGDEQFEIQKLTREVTQMEDGPEKNRLAGQLLTRMNELQFKIIARSIEYIKTPEVRVNQQDFIVDFLKNCDKRMFENIRNRSMELREQAQSKQLKIVCQHCQHNYEQKIEFNITDFFV
jgi:T4 bacteriophage base plate protein